MENRIADFVRRKQSVQRRHRGQAYPAWVRSEAMELCRALVAQGIGLHRASRLLHLSLGTLRRWQRACAGKPVSLVPVRLDGPALAGSELPSSASSDVLSVTSPEGWRIEGLDIVGVVALMERLR